MATFLCHYLLIILIICFTQSIITSFAQNNKLNDSEFAEFEDFDNDEEFVNIPKRKEKIEKPEDIEDTKDEKIDKNKNDHGSFHDTRQQEDDDADLTIENEEFEHFEDNEEFEGRQSDSVSPKDKVSKTENDVPSLKIADIPAHLRTNWESYYLEMLMLAGLAVYLLNFLAGKSKNYKLAQAWFNSHRHILEENFTIVGDDGTSPEPERGTLIKDTDSIYSLWCSGRVCCEGMLVELRLLKRQDLINVISKMFKPAKDQVIIKVNMDAIDSFVFAVGTKKACGKLHKEMFDLNSFCAEKSSGKTYGLPSNFTVLSECGEVTHTMLDAKIKKIFSEYEDLIEYIHFSDQFSGLKQNDDSVSASQTTPANATHEPKKSLIFCFNIPGQSGYSCNSSAVEEMLPLLKMVFYCIDKVFRFRLSKEAKTKSKKNRDRVLESMAKLSHTQRQEAAQTRREEKVRAEKEKMMNEEDPEKQKRYEKQQAKLEAKRKQPKMKMMKVRM